MSPLLCFLWLNFPLSLVVSQNIIPSSQPSLLLSSAALPLAPTSAHVTELYKNYTFTMKAPLRQVLSHLSQELILNKSHTSQILNTWCSINKHLRWGNMFSNYLEWYVTQVHLYKIVLLLVWKWLIIGNLIHVD